MIARGIFAALVLASAWLLAPVLQGTASDKPVLAGMLAPAPIAAAPIAAVPAPTAANAASTGAPGVFVLGIDGADPVILQRMMDEGLLPNFSRLAAQGSFQELGTANPPQSPVAWSSFVTGLDPGGHGIFDFVHRDPATYTPIPSATPPPSGDLPSYMELFGYIMPLGGETIGNNRSGTPFWDLLDAAGVDVEVYRMPGNYPVPDSDAMTLSGMGTVDMRGEFGKFTWYTDDAFAAATDKADLELVTVDDEDLDGTPDTVHTRLKGPPDIFHLKPGQIPGNDDYLIVDVTMHIDPEEDVVWIKAGDSECLLQEGEFSEWMQVSFDALPAGAMAMSGIVRFYAKEIRPTLRVYASPVNVDPSAPAQPIATPDGAAEELCEAIGFYATQGFPEDINALKDGLFSDDDYKQQIKLVHDEAELMLDEALARFEPGDASFFYLSDIDLQCHMFWRHGDPKDRSAPRHPGYDPEVSPRFANFAEGYYQNADRLLGKVMDGLPEGSLLLAMSDHGFAAQTRMVHLNDWLAENGYLVLKPNDDGTPRSTGMIGVPPDPETHEPDFDMSVVDWSRTRAYGVGFNGLYLNIAGREARGIVQPGAEAEALAAEISAALTAFTDPQTGRRPVLSVVTAEQAYAAARRDEGPDLVIGYDAGYGCSDDSTLGKLVGRLLDDNSRGFTGNHLMAPEVVPGILLANRRLPAAGHDLTDLTVTLLQHFGVEPTPEMKGRSVLGN